MHFLQFLRQYPDQNNVLVQFAKQDPLFPPTGTLETYTAHFQNARLRDSDVELLAEVYVMIREEYDKQFPPTGLIFPSYLG